MATIEMYGFEDEDGETVGHGWMSFDIQEAREYARSNRLALIAYEYEYADSSLVEDYRPGHALDGTSLEE